MEIPRAKHMHLSPYQLAAYFDGGGDGFKNKVNESVSPSSVRERVRHIRPRAGLQLTLSPAGRNTDTTEH